MLGLRLFARMVMIMQDIRLVLDCVLEVRNKIVEVGWCGVSGFSVARAGDGYSLRFVLDCKHVDGKDFVALGGFLSDVFDEWLIGIDGGKFVISGVVGRVL